jgi:hypothetical protein
MGTRCSKEKNWDKKRQNFVLNNGAFIKLLLHLN